MDVETTCSVVGCSRPARHGGAIGARCDWHAETGVPVAGLLEHAEALCEARMAELGEGKKGGEIPRAWFEYHDIAQKLRPLKHAAARVESMTAGAKRGRWLG